MPLDPHVDRLLRVLNATHYHRIGDGVAQRRASLCELLRLGGSGAPMSRVEDALIPGWRGALPVRTYTPVASDALLPGMVYFHGGGLVAGDLDSHDGIARALAAAGRCRIVSVAYRLAPEHVFPAAVEDAIASFVHIASHAEAFGIDAQRLGICGDSVGGGLAAAAAQALARNAEGPRIALQLLLCPVLDYSNKTASRRELSSGYLVSESTVAQDLRLYLGTGAVSAEGVSAGGAGTWDAGAMVIGAQGVGAGDVSVEVDLADPRLSPLRADGFSGLPATIVHTAEYDPMRDEARNYCDELKRAGTPATYSCHLGMIHLFYGLGAAIPYARVAYEQIGADIRRGLLPDDPSDQEENP